MKCNWNDCENEASSEIPFGFDAERVNAVVGYCARHYKKAAILQDPEVEARIAEHARMIAERARSQNVISEKDVIRKFAQKLLESDSMDAHDAETYASAVRQANVKKPLTGHKTDEDGYVDLSIIDAAKGMADKLRGADAHMNAVFGNNEGAIGLFTKKNVPENPALQKQPWYKNKWTMLMLGMFVATVLIWFAVKFIAPPAPADPISVWSAGKSVGEAALMTLPAIPNVSFPNQLFVI